MRNLRRDWHRNKKAPAWLSWQYAAWLAGSLAAMWAVLVVLLALLVARS